jgi:hypothetical protein
MNRFAGRRQFLSRTLQATAAGGLVSTLRRADTPDGGPGTDPVRVWWDTQRRRWPQRPEASGSLILFVSTSDPTAPQPRDFDIVSGDVWWRHPSSQQSLEQWRL